MKNDFLEGQYLLIDKPLGWSSFAVVHKIRHLICKKYNLKKIKIGHCGTLDPLASGLLILCTGKFTKKISNFQNQEKTYTGIIALGSSTPSYDLETKIDKTYPTHHITENLLEETRQKFTGNILQKPPLFSALKKDGKRLYKIARKGEKIEIPPREVFIKKLEITKNDMPEIHFEIVCGKGTYIRSIAHDFGKALKSGGHLKKLRRTKIGNFDVKNALSIAAFTHHFF